MHVEQAMNQWIKENSFEIENYTVAPYFEFNQGIGGHEWLIEFSQSIQLTQAQTEGLDQIMCQLNSDYETKRANGINMLPLKIRIAPKDTFKRWMKKNGKFGGQHKIPRVQNDRKLLEELISLLD